MEKRYSGGTEQEMVMVIMTTGCPHGWSDIHPDVRRPRVLVTPMADTSRAELEADTPEAMAAEGRWVKGM